MVDFSGFLFLVSFICSGILFVILVAGYMRDGANTPVKRAPEYHALMIITVVIAFIALAMAK